MAGRMGKVLTAVNPMGGSKQSCCCFHIYNSAAIVGTLQFIWIGVFLGNSGAMYHEYQSWIYSQSLQLNTSTTGRAFLQIFLADTIAYNAVWLLCLFFFALSFRNMKAVMVIPNIIMQISALIWGILYIGAISQAIYELQPINPSMMTDQQKQRAAFYVAALAFGVIMWITELIFTIVIFKYHNYLKDLMGSAYPHAGGGGTRRPGSDGQGAAILENVQ